MIVGASEARNRMLQRRILGCSGTVACVATSGIEAIQAYAHLAATDSIVQLVLCDAVPDLAPADLLVGLRSVAVSLDAEAPELVGFGENRASRDLRRRVEDDDDDGLLLALEMCSPTTAAEDATPKLETYIRRVKEVALGGVD